MALNDPTHTSANRQPRLKILCAGSEIPGVLSATVSNNAWFQADTFRASFALNADPAYGLQFWGNNATQQFLLDIQFSLDNGNTWTSMIVGQVDHILIQLHVGICKVDGRDLSAYLIDTKTNQSYLNQTSSAIAEQLAAKHGMQADVVPTTTLVGRYYSEDHDRLSANQFVRTTTEWNLLCSLASHEQYDVYVTGTTLHFRPFVPPTSDPYLVVWDPANARSNAETLDLDRSMFMSKNIIVQIKSWNSKSARAITKTAGKVGPGLEAGTQQLFSYVIPNLTHTEAQTLANSRREELTKQERLFSFSMPADLVLAPRLVVQFSGTGTDWDQAFQVASIQRTISFDNGFSMSCKTKNHSPQTDAPGL